MRFGTRILFGCALLALSACGPMAEDMQMTGDGVRQMSNDTQDAWRNVFTYHPRPKPQLPQTRYCYHTQSDIVCYDSPQNNQTAKLVGYQDGSSISWFQPGGGSVGASGGEPTAPHDAKTVQVAPNLTGTATVINTASPDSTAVADVSVQSNMPGGSSSVRGPDPFYVNESPYVKKSQ
jgi:hypothetical protein